MIPQIDPEAYMISIFAKAIGILSHHALRSRGTSMYTTSLSRRQKKIPTKFEF